MPRQTWTINSVSGGNDTSDLIGCKLKQTDTGFKFKDANNDTLVTSTQTSLPLTFDSFPFEGYEWTITVDSITSGPSNNQASGSWSNNDPTVQGDEDGTWVAQAGGGVGEDDDEVAQGATL